MSSHPSVVECKNFLCTKVDDEVFGKFPDSEGLVMSFQATMKFAWHVTHESDEAMLKAPC